MLRKFKIAIDGSEYLVEMEEIGGVPQPAAAPTMAATATLDPEPAAEPIVETAPAGADAITAPMPGTILKILVAPGSPVKENQPLMILEAMKMENEIVAGKAGTVSALHVKEGDVINPGEALITIN
ncbi:acetyl-CoA carboxylase biotin carboxyl carrier protein subunit [Enterococcus malodoratus]|uniref:Acetyl-CoA carboxylase biotin carboxyl carrier protein subunit n=1 Tax=Enterococcus malodoratus ATCC 43197 TaxID=1158601 RepID=R2NIX5_9ENTE|nr:acetyl-CoA carboxylase biotin carboxyl carrier protein subunit [Enterococcus malodoratus]BBM19393.1 acetyl-CoA carboxylase biotin carboxyl carrier protein subunit [Enterococcus avium]EOH72017.1 acetyl-CoA carboxylase biotin carboxyl carrier protein subunit [Enterococcus malodoratus ATCC 43197]EOT69959.1 hypothetical protein I585_01438 [Enterococcus malodoratus ATCC 43197]OJG64099.1 acetyl-CoA carboxylase biotin carboxyl carrier protein subunit [Enterococcus malodoratus]SET11316.1 Biotin-req